MIDIGELVDFIQLLENKAQSTWHTPDEIVNSVHQASKDLFSSKAPYYGDDEQVKAALDPFVQTFQVTPANSPAGLVTLPQNQSNASPLNFARLLSAMAVSYDNKLMRPIYRDIDMVNNDEVPKRLMSQLKPVTYDWPVATSNGNGVFQLYPSLPNTCVFTYLAVPVKPVYAYTRSGTGGRVITYNPGGSTQLQWNDTFFEDIVSRAVVYLGINMDNDKLVAFMNQKSAGK